jgi:hypothetical protein
MLLKSLFGPSFWIDPGDFRAKTPNDKKEAVVIGSLLHLIMGRGAFSSGCSCGCSFGFFAFFFVFLTEQPLNKIPAS